MVNPKWNDDEVRAYRQLSKADGIKDAKAIETIQGLRIEVHCGVSRSKEESELLEHLRAEAYGNQQPSLGWRDTPTKEGSTTIPQGSTRKRVEVLHPRNGMMI